MDTTVCEWGEAPYIFTTSAIDHTSELLPFAYYTPEPWPSTSSSSNLSSPLPTPTEPIKITFIPRRNCIFASSRAAEVYRANAINDALERMHNLIQVSLEYIDPYLLYVMARDMRILPASMAENPDHLPSTFELVEVMLLAAVAHMLKLPLDARAWEITKVNGDRNDESLSERVTLCAADLATPIPAEHPSLFGLPEITIVKTYSMVNVFVVQLVTLFTEHAHLRLSAVRMFTTAFAAMKELPLDELESLPTGIPVSFTRFPIPTFRWFHWLDATQQHLFVTHAMGSPLASIRSPSIPYSLRNLQSLTRKIERANLAVDEGLLTIAEDLFAQRARCVSDGGRGLTQRPGELMLSHRSYFPATLGITRGKLTADKLVSWRQGVYTVAVNEAIGNVGFSLWPGAMLLAEYALSKPEVFDGKSLVEMGAGVGLSAAIIPYASSPRRFVTTDYLAEILRLLAGNLQLNGVPVVDPEGYSDAGSGENNEHDESGVKHDEADESKHNLSVPVSGIAIPPILAGEINDKHPLPVLISSQETSCASTQLGLVVSDPHTPLTPASPVTTSITSPHVCCRENAPSVAVEVRQLDWTEPDEDLMQSWSCDISLSADCVYAPELIAPHLSCMRILMGLPSVFTSVEEDLLALEKSESEKSTPKEKFCIMAFQKRNPETFEKLQAGFSENGLQVEEVSLDDISHKFSEYYSRNLMFLFHVKPVAASSL